MKIKREELYSVDLYEEPHKNTDHKKTLNGKLKFTGTELIEAIVSAGMPDIYLTKSEKRNRREEIYFKVKLFETYVSSTKGNLSFDISKKIYLDSTEIGAINYWIGMVLTTLLGKKKYHYDFMVHLSMIGSFSSKIQIKKRTFFSTSGKVTFKSPDLLAINSLKNTYGVFESKGYSYYDKSAMERGYEQVKSIKKVNGKPPQNSLVVMTQTGTKRIQMIEKDPDGENIEININLAFLYVYHFLPIVELINDLNPDKKGDWIRGSLTIGEDNYYISIPFDLYHELSKITHIDNDNDKDKKSFKDELTSEIISREQYLLNLISEKSMNGILCVE